jgi:multiple antibiotic resistance protein
MPEQLIPFSLAVFAGFFAIMNPIVNTPIFIGLTEGFDKAKRRKIAFKSTVTAYVIVLVMALFGKLIFHLFGLTLPAFRITGGILVFLIGIELLRGEAAKTREPISELEQDDQAYLGLAITPLATPILAGPGAIVTAVNFIAEGSVVQDVVTLGIFAVMCFWTYWMFVSGQRIVNFLGRNAVTVIGRLMGLILATLGVHMLSLGIYGSVVEGMRFIAEQP